MEKKDDERLKIKKRRTFKWKVFFCAAFVCYLIIIVKVTLLERGNFYGNQKIYPLFYSYMLAYHNCSFREWRNLVLNIFMFVPYGMLLPLIFPKMQKAYKTYLAGFLTSFLIELLQLVLKRGVCELDDLMNNTIGTMIGFGLFAFLSYIKGIIKKEKEVGRISKVLYLQIPLWVMIFIFGGIYIVYQAKEFGNLSISYCLKQRNIDVELETQLLDQREEQMIYQCKIYTVEEATEKAKEIFEKQGYVMDEAETLVYQNTVVFYSDDGKMQLWFEFKGGTYECTDFGVMYADEKIAYKENASRSEVERALENIGITVPKEAVFEEKKEGVYCFGVIQVLEEGKLLDGSISCCYYDNGKIGRVSNAVLSLDEYKSVTTISEKEAYVKIEQGEFSYYRENGEKLLIKVYDVNLGYDIDSKGYYQPVYSFDVKINDIETMIKIPALL